jgi:hypothetical protein
LCQVGTGGVGGRGGGEGGGAASVRSGSEGGYQAVGRPYTLGASHRSGVCGKETPSRGCRVSIWLSIS